VAGEMRAGQLVPIAGKHPVYITANGWHQLAIDCQADQVCFEVDGLPYAIQKNISIKLEADDKIEFEADPYDMEIIFNNLLSNAVKYNRDNGIVTVGISKEKDGIVILVSDNGIGMTEEEASQLFKELVRIRNDKTKNISGSGLGLSIVRKITDIYHGKISVTSKPDEGTTFRVELPV